MLFSQKLESAVRYLFQRGIAVYWVGGSIFMLLMQYIFLSKETRQFLLYSFDPNMDYSNKNMTMDNFYELIGEISIYIVLSFLVTVVLTARGLDAAKRISEGDMDASSLAPVARIGWRAVMSFFAGSITVILALSVAMVLCTFVLTILGNILGNAMAILLFVVFILAAIIILFYAIYMSTLVFIETLSFRAMVNPSVWRSKLKLLGKAELAKIILILFVLGFVLGFASEIINGIFGFASVIAIGLGIILSNFIIVFSFVWLGHFVGDEMTAIKTDKINEKAARLLYDADTHGMTHEEKQHFANELQHADRAAEHGQYAEAIALLEPYLRSSNQAARYYPVYQRLYDWYHKNGDMQKFASLQAQVIRYAAQGNERFYQLVEKALFELATENNTQFAANDIYPLAKLALAHQQPDTVLALVKDFRKRQGDHPDVVKVYTCAIKALMQQDRNDIAKQVAEQILGTYPNHPDSDEVRHLSSRL